MTAFVEKHTAPIKQMIIPLMKYDLFVSGDISLRSGP
jgi:hypothetical protein